MFEPSSASLAPIGHFAASGRSSQKVRAQGTGISGNLDGQMRIHRVQAGSGSNLVVDARFHFVRRIDVLGAQKQRSK
jgi:hypothetical protein